MSEYRYDGSIESANTPTSENTFHRKDYATYRCMITEVYFQNDLSRRNITQNSTSPQVLYEAVILGGFKEGQLISNIRMANLLSGVYNYEERILRKTSKDLLKDRLDTHDGDIVYITFNQGSIIAPIIIGCDKSFLNESDTGATMDDGPRLIQQYNGVFKNINKDGEFFLTRKGGTYDSVNGYFVPVDSDENEDDEADTFQAKFHLLANKMLWEDPQSSILFEKDEKKYTLSVGKEGDGDEAETIYSEIIDATAKTKTSTWKEGIVTVEDSQNDKLTITTIGGAIFEVDGTGDKITITTAGGAVVTIDGAIDKVTIKGATIELGEGATEAAILGNLFMDLYNAHTHPTGVGPSGTPTKTMSTSELSSTVTVLD